jgi:DNA invertase Pin-like site-specific DNA recombinase
MKMGMKIGYARTSTLDQVAGFEAQLEQLRKEGCEKIFQEQVSSVANRKELRAAIDFAREDDIFIVCKLDRLARSTAHLLEVVQRLEGKGVTLRVLDMSLDTSTANGRLMLTMLGAVAQFEREMMLERQREGIAKARQDGKYKGRKPTARAKAGEIKALAGEGMTRTAIAQKLGIGVASVYRVLQQ